jgi:hypothetical protein
MNRFLQKAILILIFFNLYSGILAKEFVISRNFVLFTSKNLQGYLEPLFTTLEQSFNSSLFGSNYLDGNWSFSLGISVSNMIIPNNQKHFDAELPDGFNSEQIALTSQIRGGNIIYSIYKPNWQPTVYGGSSTPIFSAPQEHSFPDSMYKTVAYPEGLGINFMLGLPVVQLIVEYPMFGEFRFRFFSIPVQQESLVYFTLAFNQRIDHLFKLFGRDKDKSLALHFALHRLFRQTSIDVTSYAFGVNLMHSWSRNVLGYIGIQVEDMWGKFKALKDTAGLQGDVVNSPFMELRYAKPIEFNFTTFTKFQIRGGMTFLFPVVSLSLDLSYASQPMLTFGLNFHLGARKDE